MALFNRIVTVDVGPGGFGLFVDKLRVNFQVEKTLQAEPNKASVFIYNLAPSSRSRIREIDHQLILKAGYGEDVGPLLLFSGDVTAVANSFEAPDVITKIECNDGGRPIRETRDVFSFIEGTEAGQVLSEIAAKFGLTIRELPVAIRRQFIHGFSFAGTAQAALNIVTQKMGLEWSIQNGELQVLASRTALRGAAIAISQRTGLLEVPQPIVDLVDNLIQKVPKPGYRIKTLLNPQIEPGKIINLNSTTATGSFRVERVTHIGDTHADDFYSISEIKEV